MIGTRLGPYELLKEVGRGGMATVYRAYQPSMDRHVAVKVIHDRLSGEQRSVDRFQREARLVARLEHPHILPIYDFDGTHTPQYIVLRYVAGGTLRDAMGRDQPLTAIQVLPLFAQLASALDYAHRQGIVHRDLKPSNVMVDSDGNAFLTDFGIACLLAEGDSTLTMKGALIGTPDYMAPEQALAETRVGPAADLYALAAVLFEVLTGQIPFPGPTPMARMLLHINATPPRLSDLSPHLPTAVDEVLHRALAKSPEERFTSAAELIDALARALGLSPGTGLPAPVPLPRTDDSRVDSWGSQVTLTEHSKLVTALCVNAAEHIEMVEGSVDAETARQTSRSLWDRVQAEIEGRHGQVVTRTQTSLLVLWGAETTLEDDAETAVHAALAVHDLFRHETSPASDEEEPTVRIGLHTGPALLTPVETDTGASGGVAFTASGATLSVATRLAERAGGGILIGHDTFRQVRGVFELTEAEPVRLRGRSARAGQLRTYRVQSAKARSFRFTSRGVEGVSTVMVGRRAQLELLQRAFLAAAEDRETQAITVVAGAGLGKSRLLDEFETWAELRPERFYIFRGRPTPSSGLTPFALLRDIITFRFDIKDSDPPPTVLTKLEEGTAKILGEPAGHVETAHLIGHLTGFDLSASRHVRGLVGDPEQLATRARRLFLRFIRQAALVKPVLITLEDVHNADEASLDLLAELADGDRDLPLVMLFLARPRLLERRPAWSSGVDHHRLITLEPLDRRDSRQLAGEILKQAVNVPTTFRDLLVERAEGNPLFMEELVKMLLEDRVIVKESDERWRIEAERFDDRRVPPTLTGLLQARLDTLLLPERITLQRAAVVGRVFTAAAVEALDAADGPSGHIPDLVTVLTHLVERGFLHRRELSSRDGSSDYVFAQNMLRDLILGSLLHRQRVAYHSALADWLSRDPRAEEHLPRIAEQHEQAGHHGTAAAVLARAGDRALTVCAFAEARGFYRRALELATVETATRSVTAGRVRTPTAGATAVAGRSPAALRLALGEAERLLGHFAEASEELELAATTADDPGTRAGAMFQLSQVASAQGDYGRAQGLLDDALPHAREAGEPAILAQVLYGLGDLLWRDERYDEAVPTLEASLEQARLADDPSAVLYALNRLGSVRLFQGRTEAARDLYEEGRALASSTGNRDRLMAFLNNLGEIERREGRFEPARDLYRETLAISREIGRREVEAVLLSNLAAVSLKLDEEVAAESYAVEGLALARGIGLTRMVVGSLILFAQLAARTDDPDRALDLLGLVQAHPAADADLRAYAAPVLETLAAGLDPDRVQTGLRRGRALDFDSEVHDLLELRPKPTQRP